MTNEEASQRIQVLRLKVEEPTDTKLGWLEIWIHKEDVEALRMATKALEQESKTGHWIPVYQGDEIIDYRCSECEFGNTFGKGTIGMNFCPVCGVKMVEIQESEDEDDNQRL